MCCFPFLHRADSVAWNPHKMLMTGLQCSAFLLRDTSVGIQWASLPAQEDNLSVIRRAMNVSTE